MSTMGGRGFNNPRWGYLKYEGVAHPAAAGSVEVKQALMVSDKVTKKATNRLWLDKYCDMGADKLCTLFAEKKIR